MSEFALFANDIINGQIDADNDGANSCEDDGEFTENSTKLGTRNRNSGDHNHSLVYETDKCRGNKKSSRKNARANANSNASANVDADGGANVTGLCSTCNTKMYLGGNELVCQNCGATADYEEYNSEYTTNSSIRVRVGTSYHTINSTTNSRKIQYESIASNLIARQIECMNNGDACIPNEVISAVTKVYNSIQTNIGRCGDSFVQINSNEPLPDGVSKLVYRSKPRGTILMAIICHKLHEFGLYRSDKTLKNFMQTPDGVSKGETILRKMKEVYPELDIKFTMTSKSVIPNITAKFLDSLGVDYAGGSGDGHDVYCFVVDLVERAISETIGHKSQPTSKIAGGISIANELYKLGKKRSEIESACDNTKFSTYSRFTDEVYNPNRINALADIFSEYGFDCSKPAAFNKTRAKKKTGTGKGSFSNSDTDIRDCKPKKKTTSAKSKNARASSTSTGARNRKKITLVDDGDNDE